MSTRTDGSLFKRQIFHSTTAKDYFGSILIEELTGRLYTEVGLEAGCGYIVIYTQKKQEECSSEICLLVRQQQVQ